MKRSFEEKRSQALKKLRMSASTHSPSTEVDETRLSPIEENLKYESSPYYKSVEIDIITYKKRGRNPEVIPKFVQKGDMKNLTITLPPMRVGKYPKLGKNGNLGGRFSKDPKRAKFTVSLIPGQPVGIDDDNLKDRQINCIHFIKEQLDKAMGVAYHEEDCWKEICEGKTEEEFIENATHSVIKYYMDDDDGEMDSLNLTRSITQYDGSDNSPVFWQMGEDGELKVIKPEYIQQDSIIEVQIQLRPWKMMRNNKWAYGFSGDLQRDIVVLKLAERKEYKPSPNLEAKPTLPYIPFTVDE